ncbi:MAG: hypothetical protein EXS09_08950 [Gemmataceae bacterium]|nr:hypothetical protein [Gemmataceae bacterium]
MAGPSSQPPTAAGPASATLVRIADQSQIEFELEFFSSLLEHSPDFVEVLKEHAKNLAQVRRHPEGLSIDRRIAQLRPGDSLARYNLACSLALTRHKDEAIAELREAVQLGYRDFDFIKQDRDLDAIRRDPRFREILREYDRTR